MGKKSSRESNYRASRPRKRRFHGNRHTLEGDTTFASTSAAKLQKTGDDSFDVHVDPLTSYCFIHFFMIFGSLQSLLKCKTCDKDITFSKYGERGLGFKLCVTCECGSNYIDSTPLIDHAYEINRRFVFAMRLIGVGIHGINLFCSFMDLCNRFNNNTYYQIVNNIHIAVKTVYDIVRKKAAKEEIELNKEAGLPEKELTVSGDGSWVKRDFSSLLGIVSVIGRYSNKILDVVVKSSICEACDTWKNNLHDVEFEAWYEDHKEECQANHEGSAGKMEVDGIVEIFQRSEADYGVKYACYIGDGDTKTFKNLLDSAPYGENFVVKRKECILHVKKRMFRRVKEVKKELTQLKKAEELENKSKKVGRLIASRSSKAKIPKSLQLTTKVMKDLSVYYGLAILQHNDSIEDMRKDILATYYHKISTDENPRHMYCPEGVDSWCEWRKHEAAKTQAFYNHPPAFDKQIQHLLEPVYAELSSDDLLERCLSFNTQNSESFNSCVWNMAPKHIFCGKTILEIATFTAACIFNEGFAPLLKIMEVMGIKIGPKAVRFVDTHDEQRVVLANRFSSEISKEIRSARRKAKAADESLFEEAEGILYSAG